MTWSIVILWAAIAVNFGSAALNVLAARRWARLNRAWLWLCVCGWQLRRRRDLLQQVEAARRRARSAG